jgi:hypothetical protein
MAVLAHAAAALAVTLSSFPVVTVACNGHAHSHSRRSAGKEQERMCSHDDDDDDDDDDDSPSSSSSLSQRDDTVNGLAGDVNGRRAQASFRVGETDFGTWDEFTKKPLARCATVPPQEAQMKQLPQILARWQERMAGPSSSGGGDGNTRRVQVDETIVIPVYFHVILNTEGTEGQVSADTIAQQFSVLDASFAPYFSFSLQGTDESQNTAWFTAVPRSAEETEMKTALRQGGNDALNLYTSIINGESLGWAIFPIAGTGTPGAAVPMEDGVVVRYDSLPGGDLFPFNEGDTAVHETGHWLGLLHTFDGLSCTGEGDTIADTPSEAEPGYGCPTERDVRTCCWICSCVLWLLLYFLLLFRFLFGQSHIIYASLSLLVVSGEPRLGSGQQLYGLFG